MRRWRRSGTRASEGDSSRAVRLSCKSDLESIVIIYYNLVFHAVCRQCIALQGKAEAACSQHT